MNHTDKLNMKNLEKEASEMKEGEKWVETLNNLDMEENDIQDTAIVRLEQLCPFPTKELQDEVSRYKHVKSKPPSQSIHSFEVRSSYKT